MWFNVNAYIGINIEWVMLMAVRYKVFGKQEYAYRIWNEKNLETKKWVQHSEYLGVVVDKEKGIYEKRNKVKQLAREAAAARQPVLDYGDSYFINGIIEKLPIFSVLKIVFGNFFDTLMALVFHRITFGQAMCYAEDWYNGNFVSRLFPGADMSSQNISRFYRILAKKVYKELSSLHTYHLYKRASQGRLLIQLVFQMKFICL